MTDDLGAVLVTGAGGAAAVTLILSLRGRATVVAADIDPLAVGLYLVPESSRALLPRGDDRGFVDALLDCARAHGATLVIPTVDVELLPVSLARERFAAEGIDLLVESPQTLRTCLDKAELMRACAAAVRVPRTVIIDADTADDQFQALGEPFIIKPRRGAGGRGFEIVAQASALRCPRDGTFLAQELLPGAEYSIDVLGRRDGHIVAAVPRSRDKVDSGIAVAGRTVADPELVAFGRAVGQAIGVVGVVNVQVKRTADGEPALLEVNARFPGTMAQTQAAGIDMPVLAVSGVRGAALPDELPFAEVAVVRHWAEVVVPVQEYGRIRR